MIVLRLLRIAVIALAMSSLLNWSQQATLERSGETVPGVDWALGVLALIFLVTASATEWTRRFESDLQKDLIWGLGTGCFVTLVCRLFG